MQAKILLTGYMRDISRKEFLLVENVENITQLEERVFEQCAEFENFPFQIIADGKVIRDKSEKISENTEYILMPLFIGG